METLMEDIERWISEGWRFRVKIVKGRRYITRYRKGKERGVEPYSEELWNYIKSKPGALSKPRSAALNNEALKNEVSRLCERLEKISILLPETVHGKKFWLFTKIGQFTRSINALKRRISEVEEGKADSRKLNLLEYSVNRRFRENQKCIHNIDGYCTWWTWGSKIKDWPMRRRGEDRFELRVEAYPYRIICAACPSYRLKSGSAEISELKALIDTTFQEGACGNCGRLYLMPKFLDMWICPHCGQERFWKEEYKKTLRPLSS